MALLISRIELLISVIVFSLVKRHHKLASRFSFYSFLGYEFFISTITFLISTITFLISRIQLLISRIHILEMNKS